MATATPEWPDQMIKKSLVMLPWFSLAVAAFATLCPIAVRPHISNNSYIEHFSAFAIIGLLFCLTYPRQTFLISVVVLGSATLLEIMQFLTHDRHGRISDLEFKLAGAIVGIAAGKVARQLAIRRL
jgi:predicted signal transduction protein with EAL and GGDEF domain